MIELGKSHHTAKKSSCQQIILCVRMVKMEVSFVSPAAIRIKGKQASLVVDPFGGKTKFVADGVVLLQQPDENTDVEGSRLTIAGPGEYEVGGIKVTGIGNTGNTCFYITIDAVQVLVAKVSSLTAKENLRDVDMAILLSDGLIDQSILATVTNSVALFYGTQAAENVKALGKESSPVQKYVTTKDKLPTEMEVVLLQ